MPVSRPMLRQLPERLQPAKPRSHQISDVAWPVGVPRRRLSSDDRPPKPVQAVDRGRSRKRRSPLVQRGSSGGKSTNCGSFKRNDRMLEAQPIGIVAAPGSGVTDNLVDKARRQGIADPADRRRPRVRLRLMPPAGQGPRGPWRSRDFGQARTAGYGATTSSSSGLTSSMWLTPSACASS